MSTIIVDRAQFLRRLSEAVPRFVVLKHVDDFLQGRGDIDASAPATDIEALSRHASAIACEELAATHMIVCDCLRDVRFHFFVQPSSLPELVELDIWTQPSRGSTRFASPERLVNLGAIDEFGIRRLRPGAEAVFHVVYQGLRWSGGGRVTGRDAATVDAGVADDPEGVAQACRVLPPRPVSGPLTRLMCAVSRGSWSSWNARLIFLLLIVTGTARPAFVVRRAFYRLRYMVGAECVMFRLMRRQGRQVPNGDLEALLTAARTGGHLVEVLDATIDG